MYICLTIVVHVVYEVCYYRPKCLLVAYNSAYGILHYIPRYSL